MFYNNPNDTNNNDNYSSFYDGYYPERHQEASSAQDTTQAGGAPPGEEKSLMNYLASHLSLPNDSSNDIPFHQPHAYPTPILTPGLSPLSREASAEGGIHSGQPPSSAWDATVPPAPQYPPVAGTPAVQFNTYNFNPRAPLLTQDTGVSGINYAPTNGANTWDITAPSAPQYPPVAGTSAVQHTPYNFNARDSCFTQDTGVSGIISAPAQESNGANIAPPLAGHKYPTPERTPPIQTLMSPVPPFYPQPQLVAPTQSSFISQSRAYYEGSHSVLPQPQAPVFSVSQSPAYYEGSHSVLPQPQPPADVPIQQQAFQVAQALNPASHVVQPQPSHTAPKRKRAAEAGETNVPKRTRKMATALSSTSVEAGSSTAVGSAESSKNKGKARATAEEISAWEIDDREGSSIVSGAATGSGESIEKKAMGNKANGKTAVEIVNPVESTALSQTASAEQGGLESLCAVSESGEGFFFVPKYNMHPQPGEAANVGSSGVLGVFAAEAPSTAAPVPARKRGRPRKDQAPGGPSSSTASGSQPRPRGRPPKVKNPASSSSSAATVGPLSSHSNRASAPRPTGIWPRRSQQQALQPTNSDVPAVSDPGAGDSNGTSAARPTGIWPRRSQRQTLQPTNLDVPAVSVPDTQALSSHSQQDADLQPSMAAPFAVAADEDAEARAFFELFGI